MNGRVFFTFHGGLNDFLPLKRRGRPFTYDLPGTPSVKDAIEACGVPHPEVRLILVETRPVDFSHRLESGHRISVYPADCHPPIPEANLLPIRPMGRASFIADVHLGVLARFLRMLGFDCRYESEDPGDAGIAAIAREENRIVLTRDVGLLKHAAVRYGHWLRHQDARAQLAEVVTHYGLKQEFKPFTLCMRCNHPIESVAKEKVADRLPPRVLRECKHFSQCGGCERIYWKGTHYLKMKALVERLS